MVGCFVPALHLNEVKAAGLWITAFDIIAPVLGGHVPGIASNSAFGFHDGAHCQGLDFSTGLCQTGYDNG